MSSQQQQRSLIVRSCLLVLLLLTIAATVLAAKKTAKKAPLQLRAKIDSSLFKNRQGPPSEFNQHKLPEPSQASQSSDSALLPIRFQQSPSDAKKLVWTGKLPVDSTTMISLSLMSVLAKQLEVKLLDQRENEKPVIKSQIEWMGFNEQNGVPTLSYHVQNLQPGMRLFEITCPSDAPELSMINDRQPHVQLLLFNDSPVRSQTQLLNYELQVGETIGFTAFLFEGRSDKTAAAVPLSSSSASSSTNQPKPIRLGDLANPATSSIIADMDVTMPDGEERIFTMHDNGMLGDGQANDGVFGASLKATQPGIYVVQVVMRAQIDVSNTNNNHTAKGEPISILRTSQHVITVVEDAMTLIPDRASLEVSQNDEMIDIVLNAKPYSEETFGKQFVAYAEVYGASLESNGKDFVPVAWINGMTIAEKDEATGLVVLKLKMSANWLSLAKASLPLKLKNVYVLDVNTFVPLSTLAETAELSSAVNAKKLLLTHPMFLNYNGTITQNMKTGPRPVALMQSTRKAASNGHKLLLVHGYCAAGNPFSEEDFTNYEAFLDPSQSRSNDEFAKLIAEFAQDFSSVSIIGHSQGGLASLHLLNFYWSHADNAKSTADYRVLQSVGSPYRGTGLAGTLASIGKAVGFGCGSNTDLTHDGAERWLSTISMDARSNVYYHTSQYEPYSWCNIAANAVLSWPNDGTTEQKYNNLDGATSVVHLEGWCHTSGMKYPSQCTNHEQNKVMNSLAHPK